MAKDRAVLAPEQTLTKEENGTVSDRILAPSQDRSASAAIPDNNRISQIEEDDEEFDEESAFGEWSSEDAEDKPLQILLYGPSGAGKTWYAATFPKPVFLDLERGMRTTFQVGKVLRYPKDPKDVITNLDQVRDFYKEVKRARTGTFETIVIDSLNELQTLVIDEVLAEYTDKNRVMDDQLTRQDYGKVARVFLDTIRGFLSLPYHLVFICGEKDREFEEQRATPKFVGRVVWPEIRRWMDMIGYCDVQKTDNGTEYMVSYKLSPKYIAKDRLGIHERWLPNDFQALLPYATQYDG